MKRFLLLSLVSFFSLSQAALEAVIPLKPIPKANHCAKGYLYLHFGRFDEKYHKLFYHLICGERDELHAELNRYGDLSVLPAEVRYCLNSCASFRCEYALFRRLLTYGTVCCDGRSLASYIGVNKVKCVPLAVLAAKFLLILMVRQNETLDDVKDKYLEHLQWSTRIDRLQEGPLRDFIEFLSAHWEQRNELADEYEAYFNFHDAVERGDEKKLHQYLPLAVNYDIGFYDDEFGEYALDKAGRLGHEHIQPQLHRFRAFGKRFVEYIMKGTGEDHTRAAVLIQQCPALASEHIVNELGDTALHAAVFCDNLRLVQLLIMTNPLLVSRKNKSGRTPIECMIDGHQDTLLWPLIQAAKALEEEAKKRAYYKTQLPIMLVPVVTLYRYIFSIASDNGLLKGIY